jgi:signal transduction histidine kinase/CheY-like chemotaxis protein
MIGRWVGRTDIARHLGSNAPLSEALRGRFLLGFAAVAFLVSALGLVVARLDDDWLLIGFMGLYLVLLVVSLLLLRRVQAPFPVAARFELVLLAAFYVLGNLESATLHVEFLYWFALVPVTSTLLLGQRGAWEGAITAAVGMALSLWLRSQGLHFHVSMTGQAGRLFMAAIFIIAITALTSVFEGMRLRFANQAERSARARRMFLANVSHELRTPMNGVIGLAELLGAGPLSSSQREYLTLLRRSGESMVALVNDLLDLTKLESGQFKLERAAVSVRAVVADVTALVTPSASAKSVHVESEVDASVPAWVEGDPLRLRQVLLNLLGNAIKYTNSGESITVRARWAAGRLELEVTDAGIGMAPDVLARLFKPFQQADETTTRRFGGTGLGLAITAQLAQLMGGDVRAQSAVNQGSTFRVRVGAPSCAAPTSTRSPAPMKDVRPGGGTVLVVEDNPISQVVARGLCERLGFKVELAENGQQAVDAVAARDFQLVLMDCQMPVMDGYEATARIRELPEPRRHVPVVALTASAYQEELEQCIAAGMDDTLTKPLTSAAFIVVLERLALRLPHEARASAEAT